MRSESMNSKVKAIEALLVEDDAGFAGLLEEWLIDVSNQWSSLHSAPIRLKQVDQLDTAVKELDSGMFDILLVDLNLPDSKGLETFERVASYATILPILVISGLDDESLAIQAVRRGAQDYLVKNTIDGNLLLRSIRYALERHALNQELERAREESRQGREQGFLDRLTDKEANRISSQVLGLQSLQAGHPDIFRRMVSLVGDSLCKLLQMRTHKVSHNVSDDLKDLAVELGFLRCGPKDVVDIYRAALENFATLSNPKKNEAIHEECRYLAFELMGHLVSYYRPYAMGWSGRRNQFGEGNPSRPNVDPLPVIEEEKHHDRV